MLEIYGINRAKGKYICFLDADDLWEPTKIEEQVAYMKHQQCAFSYTAYYYITEEGKICSKKVNVPEKLDYKTALKDTRILTIGTMFNMEIISKSQISMSEFVLEDMATWWRILKEGYVAYGINEPLAYYRRVNHSRGSDKFKSALNRWKLYRNVEKLPIVKTIYYYSFYVKNAIRKRMK